MQIDNILQKLDNANSCAITVFGDFCLDKYLYIDSKRDETSVETGLIAYQVHRKAIYPGAGGTITQNLRALNANVYCVGLLGEDGEGFEMLKSLERIGADTGLMVVSGDVATCTYTKPMRKNSDGSYTEMNRFDFRNFKETPADLEDKLIAGLEKALIHCQSIVIMDQFLERNFASVTDRVRQKLSEMALRYADKIFHADSRGFSGCYSNIIIKCNRFELPNCQGSGQSILQRVKTLYEINKRAVVVTMGDEGAYVYEGSEIVHIPAFKVDGPVDIVGAGDAANAGIALGLSLGLSLPEAVLLGMCCSSITIEQIGVTGTAEVSQVKERLLTASG